MELELVCLGISVEPCRRLARCPPHLLRLDGLRGVEREAATDVASIRMRVVNDDVPRRVRRVLTIADEPLAGTAALHTRPLAVGEGEVVILLEERPVRGERRAERRPLMLLGALAIVRLSPTATFQACVVFPKILNVMTLGSPNLF